MLAQAPQLVDRIVAVVNKEVITFSELGAAVASAERQLRRQGTAVPERAVLERQILERLIIDKAQLQRARDTGIRIDELQLDRAVQRIAENNKMALSDFRRALERDRVSFNAWREELREQIMLSRLRERDVDDKIQVNDSEIDLFLAAQKANEANHVLGTKPSLPLSAYAGTYADSMYGTVKVTEDNGTLNFAFGSTWRGSLVHWHYDTFRLKLESPVLPAAPVQFRLDASGKVADLQADLVGLVTFKRVPDRPARAAATGTGGNPQ